MKVYILTREVPKVGSIVLGAYPEQEQAFAEVNKIVKASTDMGTFFLMEWDTDKNKKGCAWRFDPVAKVEYKTTLIEAE